MQRTTAGVFAIGAAALVAACDRGPVDTLESVEANWPMLGRYCTDCHNSIELVADLSFERLNAHDITADPELWEKVIRKLRGDLMPPPGGRQPTMAEKAELVAALEVRLDEAAMERGVDPGRVPMHRLNRAEYAASVEDLLGLKIDARAMLPADMSSEGFDNVAEVLRVTPTHIDQYLAAARDISIQAVGNPAPDPVRADYRPTRENQTIHIDGLPLGTRGGLVVEHYFPADGEYEFNMNIAPEPGTELRAYPQGWLEYRHRVILTIDGERVFEGELGGPEDLQAVDQLQIVAVDAIRDRFRNLRRHVTAGNRQVGVTFVARTYAESDKLLQTLSPGQGVRSIPLVLGVEVIGPYNPTGISGSIASRERIFTCYPASAAEELPCAEDILASLARRAFRRPVNEEDLGVLMRFYQSGYESGGFERGIQHGLMAILASIKFLYRAEPGGAEPALVSDASYRVSDLELAWRLSFFLWSQVPDDELLVLAEQQRLSDPDVLAQQVERMLKDRRARSLVTNFGFQWLSVRRLDSVDPDVRLYPNFDEDLREAFRREMELFLESVLLRDSSVVDLLTARHTFLNERLARHYGVTSVRGDQFRRVELDDSRRWGLLGKGSVLTVTSYPDRTSPVLRGDWIMHHLLATPPAPVPPGVETDLAQPEGGERPLSVRERLEQHRTEPSCNQCHGVIDPLGQPLEYFNAIGEWRERERDSGVAVDGAGKLASGIPVETPDDLREALAQRPEQFVQALTEKLMIYALGRGIDHHDMPTVRRIVREAERDGYRFSSIVQGIVRSAPFQMRRVATTDGAEELVAADGVPE